MTRPLLVVLCSLSVLGAECNAPAPEPEVDWCDLNRDQDGDGADSPECGGTDCDDTDAARYPGATEMCDAASIDEDCDPSTYGNRDADEDGSIDAWCANFEADGSEARGDDCDDARADVHPTSVEVCDSRDNDCDGGIDEGVLSPLFLDADGDGFGTPSETIESCTLLPGYSFSNGDCDDTRDDVHPGLIEACDDLDNDCNGDTDEGALRSFYVDADHDGFGTSETLQACEEAPGLAVRSGDCDDTNAALVSGSMRCVDALQYQICDAGEWSAAAGCPTQQCLSEPNGVGICR